MERLFLLASTIALAVAHVALAQQVGPSELRTLRVQGNVHLIAGAGVNVTVHVGKYGFLFVDTPPPALVPAFMAEVRKLADLPTRFIVNTSIDPEYISGTAALVTAGTRDTGASTFNFVDLSRPSVIAHANVLHRLAKPPAGSPAMPPDALPSTTYFLPTMDFSNGEAIVVQHQPGARTDGDSVVLFRGSDVISTGALFTPGRYPVIDRALGGSIQGLISALGNILSLAVPDGFASGGTKIIPGRGRICEETDVAEYRDMVVIIRDRVQDMIDKRMTLEQIKRAKPSRDYDAEYDATAADADRFVESIYQSLKDGETRRRS